MKKLIILLSLLAFLEGQGVPVVSTVTNAIAVPKGTTITAPVDSILMEKGFASGVYDKLQWYNSNYVNLASNFDSANQAVRALERLRVVDSNYTLSLEDTLKKTQALLDSSLTKLRHAQTAGEVLFACGIIIGIGLVVAGIVLAVEVAKGMGITLGATVPR
jgi:hypothetical protein